jgi:hypothetical protein
MEAVRGLMAARASRTASAGGGAAVSTGCLAPHREQYKAASTWFPHWLQKDICSYIRYSF